MVSTLTINVHCYDNMTKSNASEELTQKVCPQHRGRGESVHIKLVKRFSHKWCHAPMVLYLYSNVLLSFDLPFPRLSVHRHTDRQTDRLTDRQAYSMTTVTLRCACARGLIMTVYITSCWKKGANEVMPY